MGLSNGGVHGSGDFVEREVRCEGRRTVSYGSRLMSGLSFLGDQDQSVLQFHVSAFSRGVEAVALKQPSSRTTCARQHEPARRRRGVAVEAEEECALGAIWNRAHWSPTANNQRTKRADSGSGCRRSQSAGPRSGVGWGRESKS